MGIPLALRTPCAPFAMKLQGWLRCIGPDVTFRQEREPVSPTVHLPPAASPLLACMVRSGLGSSSVGRLSWLRHIELGRRELLRTARGGLLALLPLSRGVYADGVISRPVSSPVEEALPWDTTAELPRRDFLRKAWEFLGGRHAIGSPSSCVALHPSFPPRTEPDWAALFHALFAWSERRIPIS